MKTRISLQRGGIGPDILGDRDATAAGPKSAGARFAIAGFSPEGYDRESILWHDGKLRLSLSGACPSRRHKRLERHGYYYFRAGTP